MSDPAQDPNQPQSVQQSSSQRVQNEWQDGGSDTGQPSVQDVQIQGGMGEKEREPLATRESVPLVELRERGEMEPEVEGWLEHLEQAGEITLPEPVKDEEGNTLLADVGAKVVDDQVILPLTHKELDEGLHQKVWSSGRWLAEWCVRVIKMFGDDVRYRDE